MSRPRHLLSVGYWVSNAVLSRAAACLAALAMLSACATQGPGGSATREAKQYQARARGNYTPPGPPSDPWGPYIVEASKRFDVPERWIREVMRVESGGRLYQNGELITSSAGAMGLMQVMPGTYDELRERYVLGDDPFDPHNNVLAGAAYLREMYDIYGSPGFLAAYNAGPRRLDDYLTNNRGLPDETRRYVAKIGPYIQDSFPLTRSPAEQYAMNALPIDIPPGTRYGRAQVASGRSSGGRGWDRGLVEVAQLPEPPRYERAPAAPVAAAPPPQVPHRRGFQIIPSAVAETMSTHRGGGTAGHWAIQVGAYGNEALARAAVGSAREKARGTLGSARSQVAAVRQGKSTLYRARINGLSRESATQACSQLSRGRTGCIVLSPDAQS